MLFAKVLSNRSNNGMEQLHHQARYTMSSEQSIAPGNTVPLYGNFALGQTDP